MACENCDKNNVSYSSYDSCGKPQVRGVGQEVDSSCVVYTGPKLVCLNQKSNTYLEDLLLAIDVKICQTSDTNWSGFNYNCLDEFVSINTPGEFVDVITDYVCTLKSSYDTFTGTTFPAAIGNLQTQINGITNPNLVLCSGSGILQSDNYTQIISKLANNICDLKDATNPINANWDTCLVVSPKPTTIVEAFNVVINQLCALMASSGGTGPLPTFNNIGTCLPTPVTSSDTLVSTINKIKTRLCQSATFNIDSLTWGCVANPAPGTGGNLQAAFQAVLSATNGLVENNISFDTEQFIVVPDGCNGRSVKFNSNFVGEDRKVALSPEDGVPGTLIEKLNPGTNISFDLVTLPGALTINSTGSSDEMVKSWPQDPTPAYLDTKIEGGSTQGINLEKSINTINNTVVLTPRIDFGELANNLFNTVENTVSLHQRWCNLNCGCDDCDGSGGGGGLVQVQSDWTETDITKPSYIKNKPDFSALKVFYVDGNNIVDGDGSVLNPFRTLDLAINKVIGNGTRQNPIYPGVTIKVASYNYLTNNNLFINNTSWQFDTGTLVTYTGTGYLIDVTSFIASSYNRFHIGGSWNMTTVDGGFIRNDLPTTSSRINIEVNDAYRTGGTTATVPSSMPFITMNTTYGLSAWVQARTNITLNGEIRSHHTNTITLNGYSTLYVKGNTSYSRLGAGTGLPAVNINQRVLVYNNTDSIVTAHMYSQEISIQDLTIASDGESAVNIAGYYGNIEFVGVKFDLLQAVENFQKSSIEVGELRAADYLSKVRMFILKNVTFANNIYAPGFTEAIIYTGGVPGSGFDKNIELHNCIIPTPYTVDPQLDLNTKLGTSYNTISRFNVKELEVFADNTAATTAGLVAGDIYRSSTGQLMVTY